MEVRFNNSNHKLKEEDRMSVSLIQDPREFQAMLNAQHLEKGATVTAEDLEDSMCQHCQLINNGKNDQDDDEIELTAFDETCNNCGKPVHCAKYCRARKRTKNFKGKCYGCGRPGHKAENCWQRAENKGK